MKFISLFLRLLPNLRGKAATVAKSEQVKELSNRVLWEVVAVVIAWGIGYLVSHFSNRTTLQVCQDERAVLLKQHGQHQATLDSLYYSGKIAQQNQQILQQDEEIILLKQRLRADSIAHLSTLEAMRAVNAAIRKRQP